VARRTRSYYHPFHRSVFDDRSLYQRRRLRQLLVEYPDAGVLSLAEWEEAESTALVPLADEIVYIVRLRGRASQLRVGWGLEQAKLQRTSAQRMREKEVANEVRIVVTKELSLFLDQFQDLVYVLTCVVVGRCLKVSVVVQGLCREDPRTDYFIERGYLDEYETFFCTSGVPVHTFRAVKFIDLPK
jgi:hypothetical protein